MINISHANIIDGLALRDSVPTRGLVREHVETKRVLQAKTEQPECKICPYVQLTIIT